MDITLTTASYRLSIDTDLDFCIITNLASNTFRRTMRSDLVRALSTVIPRLTPGDDALAARLWADLSPMAEHEYRVQPVRNVQVSFSYPPMGGVHSTRPRLEPVGRGTAYHPEHLKAHSLECKAYKSINYYVQ